MLTTTPAPAASFARLIEGLCQALAARNALSRPAGPLLILAWSRLRRLAVRFAALAARLHSGTLPAAAARRRTVSHRPQAAPPPGRPRRLPQNFAWLVRLVPGAAASASQLQHLLGEPEMAALIAAAPQTRRMLRPLCRMLGVPLPPGLRPVRRVPPPAPSTPAARSPRLKRRRESAAAIRRSSLPGQRRPALFRPPPPAARYACGPPRPG
jgi:hypothetical protein